MERLCTPVLFSILHLQHRDISRLQALLALAPKLSPYVAHASISPRDPSRFIATDTLDESYFAILRHAVNIRKISILYDDTDFRRHEALAPLCAILVNVTDLELLEINMPAGQPDKPLKAPNASFRTAFLNSYLDETPPDRLHSLRLAGSIPLPRDTLRRLKQRSALQVLDLQQAIAVEDLEWFHDWSIDTGRWACASSLTSLRLSYCRGAHVSTIVNLVAKGILSECLESLALSFCGGKSDTITRPGRFPV